VLTPSVNGGVARMSEDRMSFCRFNQRSLALANGSASPGSAGSSSTAPKRAVPRSRANADIAAWMVMALIGSAAAPMARHRRTGRPSSSLPPWSGSRSRAARSRHCRRGSITIGSARRPWPRVAPAHRGRRRRRSRARRLFSRLALAGIDIDDDGALAAHRLEQRQRHQAEPAGAEDHDRVAEIGLDLSQRL